MNCYKLLADYRMTCNIQIYQIVCEELNAPITNTTGFMINVWYGDLFGMMIFVLYLFPGTTDDDYAEEPLSGTDNGTDYPYMTSVDESNDGKSMD